MSTILAVQRLGFVELGWDSLTTAGNEKYEDAGGQKVFKKDGLIFGVAGDVAHGNTVEVAKLPTYNGGDARHWIMKDLVPALRAAFEERGLDSEDSAMIVVVNQLAFRLAANWAVVKPSHGLLAIGSGGDYAVGAYASKPDMRNAIQVAALLDPYTGGYINVTTSASLLNEI